MREDDFAPQMALLFLLTLLSLASPAESLRQVSPLEADPQVKIGLEERLTGLEEPTQVSEKAPLREREIARIQESLVRTLQRLSKLREEKLEALRNYPKLTEQTERHFQEPEGKLARRIAKLWRAKHLPNLFRPGPAHEESDKNFVVALDNSTAAQVFPALVEESRQSPPHELQYDWTHLAADFAAHLFQWPEVKHPDRRKIPLDLVIGFYLVEHPELVQQALDGKEISVVIPWQWAGGLVEQWASQRVPLITIYRKRFGQSLEKAGYPFHKETLQLNRRSAVVPPSGYRTYRTAAFDIQLTLAPRRLAPSEPEERKEKETEGVEVLTREAFQSRYSERLGDLTMKQWGQLQSWLDQENLQITDVLLPDTVSLYIQGEELFREVYQHLKQPEGILFELKRLPVTEWEEWGLILEDQGLDTQVENPLALPVYSIWLSEVINLDPVQLLSHIFHHRLEIPKSAFLGGLILSDLEGKAHLILFSA